MNIIISNANDKPIYDQIYQQIKRAILAGELSSGQALPSIRALAKEKHTMIVVTHEMNFARDVADRVIYMENGLIVEDGPAGEVLGAHRSEAIRAFAGEGNY